MRHTLIELLHVLAGVVGTAVIASLAAWAVPRSFGTIWEVAFVAMAVVAFMGVRPLQLAWRQDRIDRAP